MEYTDILPKKPVNIALSFSGGGFRAASYALGCLSYLEIAKIGEKKMSDLVNFISSASGGTITNLAYTASQRKDISFQQFFKFMTEEVLSGKKVINRVFEIMDDKEFWKARPCKNKNIINAFSIAYDEIIFNKETFGIYFKDKQGAIPEVCSNATEFENGMLFRFQNAGTTGNKFIHFKGDDSSQKIMQQIKLGDILACSSCFTLGFEPFMFPEDFEHKGLKKNELINALTEDRQFSPVQNNSSKNTEMCFGLMDGGIDDNQGIDSFIKAEDRLERKNNFGHDLYISCDVSSNYTGGFDFPDNKKKKFLLGISTIQFLLLVTFLAVVSCISIFTETWSGLGYFILGISSFIVILSVIISIIGWRAYLKSIKTGNTYGLIIFPHLMLFLKMKLSTFFGLLKVRATSAGYLAAVVFLKKIRRISYDRLFEKITEKKYKVDGKELLPADDPHLAVEIKLKHWSNFTLQNSLYLLAAKNDKQRSEDLHKESWANKNVIITIDDKQISLLNFMVPSPKLQEIAGLGTKMGTTLWYDENHVRDKMPEALIAAGQFTSCFNLLRYAFRFDSNDLEWQLFQQSLINDWNRFNENPSWLYEIHKKIPIN